jgi:hypothetical protein
MVEATAYFHFEVAGLMVDVELLGQSLTVRRDEYEVLITLPASETDFGVRPPFSDRTRVLGGGTQDPKTGQWLKRSVGLVRARVDLDLPLTKDDFSPTHEGLRKAASAARRAVGDYLEIVRADYGQYWLDTCTPRVTWITSVVDRHTGEDLRVSYGDPLGPVVLTVQALSPGEQGDIRARLERGLGPDLPKTLLANAMHMGCILKPPQRREAVLLAAIACEVAIKTAIRQACPEPSKALLEYALDNPREVTQQAAGLFHVAARAVTGKSLREKDPQAWKAVGTLFEKRNRVAHYGDDVSAEDLNKALQAASTAVAWARTLIGEASTESQRVEH